MKSFERLQVEAFRYGILAYRYKGAIYLDSLEDGVGLLCDESGLDSVEEAYELFEELIKDVQEPEMSIDEAEERFPDFFEKWEEQHEQED